MDLPRIDFVEELHHDKDVEDDGVVLRWWRVQGRVAAAVDVKELLPCEAMLGKPRHFLSTSEEKKRPTTAEERKVSDYPIVRMHTGKEQREDDDELVHGVTQNVLHHGPGDEGLVAAVGFTQQQGLCGRFGGQSKRRQGVHDEVDPQHLDGLQGRVLPAKRNRRGQVRNIGIF